MKKEAQIKLLTLVFFLVGLCDLLGLIMNEPQIRYVSKPLITITLGFLYLVSVKKIKFLYLAALFFSLLGDTLLLKIWGNQFLYAVFSFLITQVLFIVILSKSIKTYKPIPLIIASIPFVLTFIAVITFVHESLGSLLVPITIYGLIITTLGGLSFYNYLEQRSQPTLWMAIGVFLFIASDSVLAVKYFMISHRELELSLIVMATYILAQYLICRYMIHRSESPT